MVTMTATETAEGFTRADLDAMPDDGRRYELLNGTIIVSAAPSPRHQRVVLRITRALEDPATSDVEVFVAPLDVALPTNDVLEPDVLVATKDTITDRDVTGTPVLAVEVLSPSSMKRGLSRRRRSVVLGGRPDQPTSSRLRPPRRRVRRDRRRVRRPGVDRERALRRHDSPQ